MKLVNLVGPIEDFDRVVMQHVIDNNMHLENIIKVMDTPAELNAYTEENPYGELLKTVAHTVSFTNVDTESILSGKFDMKPDEITKYSASVNKMLDSLVEKKNSFVETLAENGNILHQLQPIKNMDIKLDYLFNLKFTRIRFGKMPRDSYKKMGTYLADYYAFFFKYDEDKDNVYGLYLAPTVMHEKIDTIFSSLYFERVRISNKACGTPSEAIKALTAENEKLKKDIVDADKEIAKVVAKEYKKICYAYRSTRYLYEAFDTRKYAAHTEKAFCIVGWELCKEVDSYTKRLDGEENVTIVVEEPENVKGTKPPTKLSNWKLFKPFESFIGMYGLPAYNEFDPTTFFGITYSLMFGIMYGDVGHGLVLAIIGYILAKKKNFLGPILQICGVTSMIFGALYGSLFGFEELEWLHGVFKPMGSSSNMMQTLIMAVAFGAIIITISMVVNIANGVRQKDFGKVLFDSNGLAGFIFYWSIIIGVLTMIMGNSIMTLWYVIAFVVIPTILMFLKEPLAHLLERKKDWLPEDKGQFVLETFFEMFELMLSYITNTISFIRVGAFALNHAGMLAVVFSLAHMSKGATGTVIIVLGNIVVIGLEGLLVGIQVLRLEFYEMFNRFFSGDGKAFEPRKINQN